MDRLRKMEIFVTVVETGKFTDAANNLGLSKSAVSHAVRDLEEYLKLQIINRETKGLSLTAAGQDYYEECCRILSDIEAMEKNIRHEEKTYTGKIRMSVPSVYGARYMAPYIAKFSKAHPEITIALDLVNRNVDLLAEDYDVCIQTYGRANSLYMEQELGTFKVILVGTPEYCQPFGPINNLEDLAKLNCMPYSRYKMWHFLKKGRTHMFEAKGSLLSDSGEVLLSHTLAGYGVSYLPDMYVERYLKSGALIQLLPEYDSLELRTQIVYAPNRHKSQRVRALVDYLVTNVKKDRQAREASQASGSNPDL